MKKKSAYWIQKTHLFQKDEYECSSCYHAYKPYIICPHCGLRLKESKYESSWVDEMETIDAIFNA